MANIIISGANEGIGYYLIKQLLDEGNKVAVLDLQTENLTGLKLIYGSNLLYFKADMRCEEDIKHAVDQIIGDFRTVDIAIHNACKCTFSAEMNTDSTVYQDVLDVNYFGALRLTKSVLPHMVRQNNGRIIYTSSGVGVTGFMNISPYASSKGAIEALAKCLRIEYAKNNITFHIFHPPLTRTRSSASLPVPKEMMASPEKVGKGLAKNIMSKQFIICHSLGQKIQILVCYLFPTKMGSLMSKMTANYTPGKDK